MSRSIKEDKRFSAQFCNLGENSPIIKAINSNNINQEKATLPLNLRVP